MVELPAIEKVFFLINIKKENNFGTGRYPDFEY